MDLWLLASGLEQGFWGFFGHEFCGDINGKNPGWERPGVPALPTQKGLEDALGGRAQSYSARGWRRAFSPWRKPRTNRGPFPSGRTVVLKASGCGLFCWGPQECSFMQRSVEAPVTPSQILGGPPRSFSFHSPHPPIYCPQIYHIQLSWTVVCATDPFLGRGRVVRVRAGEFESWGETSCQRSGLETFLFFSLGVCSPLFILFEVLR